MASARKWFFKEGNKDTDYWNREHFSEHFFFVYWKTFFPSLLNKNFVFLKKTFFLYFLKIILGKNWKMFFTKFLKCQFKVGRNKSFFFSNEWFFFSFWSILMLVPYFFTTFFALLEYYNFEVGQLHQTSQKLLKT